jgi:DNA-binding PadR family transcriptional regulator
MMPFEKAPGLWEITVLALLREAPMHPYQMRRLIQHRRQDELLALKHGSLYHAIGRLERAGLIAVEGTSREGNRPERTTYRITPTGEQALVTALAQSIATQRREPSDFMAAVSFLIHLEPDEAIARLADRAHLLEHTIAAHIADLAATVQRVDRIHLIEAEYLLAMYRAELAWVQGLLGDVRDGKLSWNFEEIVRRTGPERERASGKGKAI